MFRSARTNHSIVVRSLCLAPDISFVKCKFQEYFSRPSAHHWTMIMHRKTIELSPAEAALPPSLPRNWKKVESWFISHIFTAHNGVDLISILQLRYHVLFAVLLCISIVGFAIVAWSIVVKCQWMYWKLPYVMC